MPHNFDFLLLRDDDLLRQPAEPFITAVPQFGLRHPDRALMVRRHHGGKVSIRVA